MKEFVKKHLFEFIWVGLLTIIFSGAFVGISIVLQKAIDYAIAGNLEKSVLVSVFFIVAFTLIYWLQGSGLVKLNQKVIKELRAKIIKQVLLKDTLEFREYKESDYISLIQHDVKKIEDNYFDTLFSIVQALTQLLFAIIVMTHYSWIFTLTMLGMTILMFLVPVIFSKKLSEATSNVSAAQAELTEGVSEIVFGYEVIKSFEKEEYSISNFEKCNKQLHNKVMGLELLGQANGCVSNVLAFSMQIVICLLAGWFIGLGKMSYGSMVGVIQVSGSITNPLFQLFTLIPAIKSLKPIWEKLESYTRCEKNIISYMKNESNRIASDWEEITFKNVDFAYPNNDKQVLTDINLKISKGKKYLIIGESGGGKSTLINVLCGNYVPQSGKILIDGNQLEESTTLLKKLSSVVWQNVFLFNNSILDNILFGSEENQCLNEVISEAKVMDVVNEKGANFVVGSNGNQLSGGQKQRIAIARALYAKKDILVLDEGVSALDSDTANEIENSVLKKNELTVISISHHINDNVLNLYDEIWEIKDGKLSVLNIG